MVDDYSGEAQHFSLFQLQIGEYLVEGTKIYNVSTTLNVRSVDIRQHSVTPLFILSYYLLSTLFREFKEKKLIMKVHKVRL